ncbi:hypothetical protein PoB_006580200, partial [Plakobranchus ocellatus]
SSLFVTDSCSRVSVGGDGDDGSGGGDGGDGSVEGNSDVCGNCIAYDVLMMVVIV